MLSSLQAQTDTWVGVASQDKETPNPNPRKNIKCPFILAGQRDGGEGKTSSNPWSAYQADWAPTEGGIMGPIQMHPPFQDTGVEGEEGVKRVRACLHRVPSRCISNHRQHLAIIPFDDGVAENQLVFTVERQNQHSWGIATQADTTWIGTPSHHPHLPNQGSPQHSRLQSRLLTSFVIH